MKEKFDMGKRIEECKRNYDERLQHKIELSKRSDIDVRDIFTPEEFDEICKRYENFEGKVADMEKMQSYERIRKGVEWMNAHCIDVKTINYIPPDTSKPNATIYMDMGRLFSLDGEALKVFTTIAALADTFFVSGMSGEHTRFSFGIEGIWKR